MAGSKSDYLEARILDHFLGATASTAPSVTAIALSTALFSDSATGASMTEVTNSNNYARVSKTNDSTNWPAASGTNPTTKSNGTAITFPTASGSWGNVKSFYIVDSATYGAGNVLYGGDLTSAEDILSGDTASFAVGDIDVTEA